MYAILRGFLSAYQSALIFGCSGSTTVKETAKYEIRAVAFLLTFKISFTRVDAAVYKKRSRNFLLRFRECHYFLKDFFL